MRIDEMREHCEKNGYAEYADIIESQAQRCIRFNLIPTEESEIGVGETKMGGSPDLPDGISWPSHGNRLLDFLVQIDLADLKPYSLCRALPSEGHLYFFLNEFEWQEGFDPTDSGNWRVIFHSGPREALQRRPRPELGIKPVHFNPCRVAFHEALSPGWDELPIQALHLDEVQEDEWQYFIDRLPGESNHQALGRPGRIQDLECGLQLECQFMSNGIALGPDRSPVDEARTREVAPGAPDWKLLLQLDSDEGAGMFLGDSMISFWIRELDLRERNFSQAWMIEEWF
jgi:uncharacterized protein YwqG